MLLPTVPQPTRPRTTLASMQLLRNSDSIDAVDGGSRGGCKPSTSERPAHFLMNLAHCQMLHCHQQLQQGMVAAGKLCAGATATQTHSQQTVFCAVWCCRTQWQSCLPAGWHLLTWACLPQRCSSTSPWTSLTTYHTQPPSCTHTSGSIPEALPFDSHDHWGFCRRSPS